MEQDSAESMEYESGEESSQGSSEYHSGQEPESERKQVILINCDEFTFLNIRFPMPPQYPHLYIQLNELMSHVDGMVPKLYDQIQSIAGDPHRALGYIIHHFNIDKVSWQIRSFPNYRYDQVYYSTYVDTTWYTTLQRYYTVTHKQLDDAIAKERLELQKKYGRYLITNDIPITLLDCFL